MTHPNIRHASAPSWAIRGTTILPMLAASGIAMAQTTQQEDSSGPALEEIVVTADRPDSFSADYVQAGTFRNARVLDTPLTVAILTKDLLEAQQALTLADATRNTAGTTASQINSIVYSNLTIRGISVGNVTNFRLNGILPIVNFIDMPIENKDRVEVLKGASGLYYGFASPAGVVNLTTERAGAEPTMTFGITANSHSAYGANIDMGRRWGDSGLRVNAAAANLESGVDRTAGDRYFVSTAYDFNRDAFDLQLDGEYIYKSISEPTEFVLPAPVGGVITLPPLQDAEKNLGAEWMKGDGDEVNLLARASYRFSPAWSAAVNVGQSSLTTTRRYSSFSGYNLTTGNGTVGVGIFPDREEENTIYRLDLAGAFNTGRIQHEILIGASQTDGLTKLPAAGRSSFAQNLFSPVSIPEQPDPPVSIISRSDRRDRGYYVLDRAKFSEWLQLTVGYRDTDYRNVSQTTTATATYADKLGSVSYSVLVKPKAWISVYGSYVEGLEEGGTAPGIATNFGEVLPAAVSEQYEFGVKLEPVRGLFINGAYFDVDRVSAYLNPSNVFVQDGHAKFEGVELSMTGEPTPDLSLAVSALFLDAVQDSGAAAVVGREIENTPEFSGSLFAEYRLPVVNGLAVTAGVFHTGKRAVNATNNAYAPSYTLYDLGVSYSSEFAGHPVMYRLNGENITGVEYWAATGSGLLAQGLPRVVKFSASVAF
jgi:iron complex outermembrane receptor protein